MIIVVSKKKEVSLNLDLTIFPVFDSVDIAADTKKPLTISFI